MEEATSERRFKKQITAISIAVLIVLVDQVTKFLALKNFTMGEHRVIIEGVLSLTLTKNSGAAFSFLSGATWLFTIISSLVVMIVIYLIFKLQKMNWAIVAGLVLAGASGNLIDRLFRPPSFGMGHVIDFIYTPWIVPAVYNIADIAIVVGMGLYLIFSLLPQKRSSDQANEVDSKLV